MQYNGRTLTSDKADLLSAEAAHREFVLVYDAACSRAGLAHAFDSTKEADDYAAANRNLMKAAGAARTTGGTHTFGPAAEDAQRRATSRGCVDVLPLTRPMAQRVIRWSMSPSAMATTR